MTRLTKTEQRVLARLQEHGRVGVHIASGRGPKGGWVLEGVREYQAARSLVRKGLATINHESNTALTLHGYTTHFALLRIELPQQKEDTQ